MEGSCTNESGVRVVMWDQGWGAGMGGGGKIPTNMF